MSSGETKLKAMLKYNIHISSRYEHMRPLIQSIVKNGVPEGTEIIYKGRNTVYRMTTDNRPIIIKSFKLPGFINSYVYTNLRKSKAERSYLNSKKLQQLGFRTPAIIAYAEVKRGRKLLQSYYISEEIVGENMRDWENKTNTDHVLHGLAQEMFKLYQARIWHKDFSPGNVLYIGSPESGYKYYYIDVNRMAFNVNSRKKLMSMFRSMHDSFDETARLARHYAQVSGEPENKIVAEALKYHKRYMDSRIMRHRLKRIFKL